MAEVSSEILRSDYYEFAVYMNYSDQEEVTYERNIFSVRHVDLTDVFQLHGTVYEWLVGLGAAESTWDAAIDQTLLGLEELTKKVGDSDSESESLGALVCSHVLHEACLIHWVLQAETTNPTCPWCRHQLIHL